MSVDRKSNEIGLPAKIGLVILVIVALCLALKWWVIDYGQVPNKPKAAPSPRSRVVVIMEMKK